MAKHPEGDAEPSIIIDMGDGDFEMTPANSTLFTFIGANALYNHVFIVTEDSEEEGQAGTYIFSPAQGFTRLAKEMKRRKFPAVLNMTEVADCDRQAFDRVIESMVADVESGVPEDWHVAE